MTTELEKMFEEREENYDDYTNAVFAVIDENVLAASYEVLKLNPENVLWQDAQLIEGIVLIIALVIYKPGDKVVGENNESVTLTAETAELYQRVIRIGVPVTLAADGTKAEIVNFLQESNKQHTSETTFGDSETTNKSFSKDNLTEEQIKQLKLYQSSHPGGKLH